MIPSYKLKNADLKSKVFKTIEDNLNAFTLKQLETVIWSLSKHFVNNKLTLQQLPEESRKVVMGLVERVRVKTASMKPRGVAFAIEAISFIVGEQEQESEQVFKKLEKVVLAKIDDFIPHYLVKVLAAYSKMRTGSGEFYDKVISRVLQLLQQEHEDDDKVKYTDLLRFMEIYPEVSYIYETTMTPEISRAFEKKVARILKERRFPTEDACRVFNVMVRTSAYRDLKGGKFITELIGKLRHSVYDIPQPYFALTLSNLLEFQQPEIASKFVFIIQEMVKSGRTID